MSSLGWWLSLISVKVQILKKSAKLGLNFFIILSTYKSQRQKYRTHIRWILKTTYNRKYWYEVFKKVHKSNKWSNKQLCFTSFIKNTFSFKHFASPWYVTVVYVVAFGSVPGELNVFKKYFQYDKTHFFKRHTQIIPNKLNSV